MQLNNKQILSEAIKYYEDFDGVIEESHFKWLIEQAKKTEQYEKGLFDIVNHRKDSLSSYCDNYVDLVDIAHKSLNY